MDAIVQVIIWWSGVIVVLAALAATTVALSIILAHFVNRSYKMALSLIQISTVQYWVHRMDQEGLTVCRAEYQRLVKERNPKTSSDYRRVEAEASADKEENT